MTPFHFGDSSRKLFGVYHRAGTASARAPAVLLCNPFGEEAIRAHRIYRILAERLARHGAHVLRFDYYGTGDSAGPCREARLAGMAGDIRMAHEELLDMSGAMRAVWVGLRLGAAAAARASQERNRGLAGLVLWDPVISGAGFLREVARAHIAHLANCFDQPAATIMRRIGAPAPAPIEALGFEISPAMTEELQALDLLSLATRPARSVMVIAARKPETDPALRARLEELGAKVDWRRDEEEISWNSDQAMNEFLVPAKTLDLLVSAIGAWR